MSRHPLGHWLLLAALVAMWGSSFLLTKVAVTSLPPPLVVTGRLVIAAALLGAVVLVTGRRVVHSRRLWAYFGALAVIGNALPFLLISWGQQRIDSGLAGILMAVMPLVTLVLAHFFIDGERLTRNRATGFVLGFVGIVVLTGPQALASLRGTGEALVAQLAVLGGAVCYAVNTIVARRRPPCDALVTAAAVVTLAALLTAPLLPAGAAGPAWAGAPVAALVAVGLLGVVCTAIATVVYFRLVTLAGPTFVSLINYLIPLWAVVLGVLFMAERPDWSALAALVLILGGIALSNRARS